jgi:DNA-directed RNA polymerase specialized sigma24 family protein
MPLQHMTHPRDTLLPLLPAMTRLARRLSHSTDAAEDLVQEAALKIWSTLARGGEIEDLRPYAMAIWRAAIADGRAAW